MKYALVFVCLLVLVQRISAQTYSSNFQFTNLYQYGVGHGDDVSVMNNPYDFVVADGGYPVVADIGNSMIFEFFNTYLYNYTSFSTASIGDVYGMVRNVNTYYLLAKNNGANNIYSTQDFVSFNKINTNSIGMDPRGLAYDPKSNTLFVSDFQNDTVTAYNLANFTVTYVYGGSGPISSSTLDGPFRMSLDAAGVWVTDQISNRVLHFPFNTKQADIVIGQNSYNSSSQGNASNPQATIRPYSVFYFAPLNTLYVSDATGRVLAFQNPMTGQNSTGILDAANDFGAQNIVTIRVVTDTDGTSVRLYFLDNVNEKITSGVIGNVPSPSATPVASPTRSRKPRKAREL